MLEEDYICWHAGQDEGDGKELKAPSVEAAAKKAVDIWRHENIKELNGGKVTVFVRDRENRIHQVIVTSTGDRNSPESFT
jgi:hypothetical protein